MLVQTAIITNGAALSDDIPCRDWPAIGLIMPAAWTAADLTFQVSIDGTNYYNLYDDGGNEVLVDAAVDRYVALPPTLFAGVLQFKVRSGTSGTPVNQGADRTITIVGRPY